MTPDPQCDEVLQFWFGELGADGLAQPEKVSSWWRKDPAFDRELDQRFSALRAEIIAGRREAWRQDPRGVLAYVVVLDQFSRNIGRDTPAMFEADGQALLAARGAVDAGMDAALESDPRVFLYMPFMHSEALADQDLCLALFERARDGSAGRARERFDGNVKYAHAHRDIIVRFGRFPHRNAILGRESTDEEAAFLQQPGSSF